MSSNDGTAEHGAKKYKSKRKLGLFSFKSKKTVSSSAEAVMNHKNGSVKSQNEEVITQVTEDIQQYHQEGDVTEAQLFHVKKETVYHKEITSNSAGNLQSVQSSDLPNSRKIDTVVERDFSGRSDSSNHSLSPVKSKEKSHRLRHSAFSHFSTRKHRMTDYQGTTHRLKVRLLSGQDLAVRDKNGLSDPYVKFKLHDNTVHKSRICYGNLNPKWDNEEFTVQVRKTDEITIKVYDKDFATRDDFMGKSSFSLDQLEEGEETELSLNLEEDGFDTDEELGRIHVAVTLTSLYETNETTEHDGLLKSEESFETMSVSSLKLQDQQVSRSNSTASEVGYQKAHSCEMRLRRTKNPVGSVHIQLVSGKGLPARDSNGLSDPYVKFQMGKQKHKSQVCFKTLDPIWKEEFTFMLSGQDSNNKENGVIEITVWDKDSYRKDDFIGRCELALGELKHDNTSECLLNLADAAGTIKLLVTLQSNLPTNHEPTINPLSLTERYALPSTFSDLSDVGFVEVKVLRANGCRAADMNGKSDPYCIIQLCNARAQTHTCYKTLDPVWNKTITFPVKDIHDMLVFTVMDEDRDGESDFLGKVSVPLLRAVNGIEKTYAMKDKKLMARSKGVLTVQIRLIYNKARAAVRTFNPREENYMAPQPRFKRHLLTRNFSRLWACIQGVLAVGEFIGSCFTWQNPPRSAAAFVVYILFVWNIELYMLPILLLLLLVRNYYHIVYKKNCVDREGYADEKFHEDDEDEENEESGSKLSLMQRLKAIEEILTKVQNALDWMASLLERIHNTFTWSVPFLSALAAIVLFVVAVILYFVSLRTIALLWGLNKFTKRLRKPNYIPNNELLDFLSRIPSEVELDELQELQISNVSPKSSKKKRV